MLGIVRSNQATWQHQWRVNPTAVMNELMFGSEFERLREQNDYTATFNRCSTFPAACSMCQPLLHSVQARRVGRALQT